MKKKIARTFAAVLLITTMTGITVFADDVNSLTKQKNTAQSELDSLQNDLSYLLTEMDQLESQMADVSDSIVQVNVDLAAAEVTQKQQYEDMKLRIKYMYEDQDASIMETFLSSESMSDALNKAEYMQQVYNYDRDKLAEMAATAQTISDKKAQLLEKQNSLNALQTDLSGKQELLYTTIDEKKDTVSNFSTLLSAAVETASKKAAAEAAAKAAAAAAEAKETAKTKVATGDASVGQKIANMAYNYIGTPYVGGGSDPSGFDCSGFTSYLYRQFGYTLSRSAGAQSGGGTRVASIADALPGDIICYSGHVALYVGNGQIIHATVPRSTVKLTSATGIGMQIQSIRRYW